MQRVNTVANNNKGMVTSGAVYSAYVPVRDNNILQLGEGYTLVDGGVFTSGKLLIINEVINRTNMSVTSSELIGRIIKTPVTFYNSFVGVGDRYTITGVGYIFIGTNGDILIDFKGNSYAKINAVIPIN